jgi:hypothetical protein
MGKENNSSLEGRGNQMSKESIMLGLSAVPVNLKKKAKGAFSRATMARNVACPHCEAPASEACVCPTVKSGEPRQTPCKATVRIDASKEFIFERVRGIFVNAKTVSLRIDYVPCDSQNPIEKYFGRGEWQNVDIKP